VGRQERSKERERIYWLSAFTGVENNGLDLKVQFEGVGHDNANQALHPPCGDRQTLRSTG
jgi:hypothetical protein